jgi:hypothetical protein
MKRFLSLLLFLPLLTAPSRAVEQDVLTLRVVWNNPFNPSRGEVTQFEYEVRGQDARVQLMVFAVDGHAVRQFPDHLALPDTPYTQDWDGRNDRGDLVDSGIYFVALDADRSARRVRRVAVLRD